MLQREGFDAAARTGRDGQFDVIDDGKLVFSKEEQDRFPEYDEIVAALR